MIVYNYSDALVRRIPLHLLFSKLWPRCRPDPTKHMRRPTSEPRPDGCPGVPWELGYHVPPSIGLSRTLDEVLEGRPVAVPPGTHWDTLSPWRVALL